MAYKLLHARSVCDAEHAAAAVCGLWRYKSDGPLPSTSRVVTPELDTDWFHPCTYWTEFVCVRVTVVPFTTSTSTD